MEHLVNPLLAKMGSEDLNQRYGESYVMYDGRPVFVQSFASLGNLGKKSMAFFETLFGKPCQDNPSIEIFNWELLNTARPRAGWYTREYPGGKWGAFHFSYPVKRQWKRGLTTKNNSISHAAGFNKAYSYTHDVYSLVLEDMVEGSSQIYEEMFTTPIPRVIRNNRALIPTAEGFNFMLQQEFIASISPKTRSILFYREGFQEELYEVGHPVKLKDYLVSYKLRPARQEEGIIEDKKVQEWVVDELTDLDFFLKVILKEHRGELVSMILGRAVSRQTNWELIFTDQNNIMNPGRFRLTVDFDPERGKQDREAFDFSIEAQLDDIGGHGEFRFRGGMSVNLDERVINMTIYRE